MGWGPQLLIRVWPRVHEWKWGPGGLFRVLVPGWVLFSVGMATCVHGLGIDMALVGSGCGLKVPCGHGRSWTWQTELILSPCGRGPV